MYRTAVALLVVGGIAAWGQAQRSATGVPAQIDRGAAYYHYTLAHMYAVLAETSPGNRSEYVNKAIENYKAAIKADPQTSMLSEELSEIYLGTGRLREAEMDAQEALKQNPNDLAALRMLARIYSRQIGDNQQNRVDEAMLRKAIEQYQKITRIDPKDVDSLIMLGRLQKVAQNSVDAQDAYKKALEADPDNEDALTGLATVYADLGDNQAAADLLKKLTEKNPNSRSLRALAIAYEQMREFSLAADALKRALDLNPPDAIEVKRALAQDLVFAERYSDALAIYQDIVQEEPSDAQSYLRISQIYLQMRDFAKAREASDKARSVDPDNLEVRYSLVRILEAEGKTGDAIQLLKDIVEGTGKRSANRQERAVRIQLLQRLAALYASNDQPESAVDAFRQAAELDPDLAPRKSAAINETYRQGKDFAKAQQEADAAVKKWPMDRNIRITRATLLADVGKVDAAAADVQKLIDGKNDRETYLSLADIYEKGKRFGDVAKSLDAAEKLSEGKEEKEAVWFMRGAMYEKMNNVASAEGEFRKILKDNPNYAPALNYLGYMLADRNMRLPEALQLIKTAVDQEPNNGAYLDSLGWAQYKLGRLDEAEENMRRAVEQTPRDPSIRDHFGDVLLQRSKLKEAIVQWQASLKEWEMSSPSELNPDEVSKVKTKLEDAKVRLAREGSRDSNKQ
jgi:tetratricopeptide (TPR) repeat protein